MEETTQEGLSKIAEIRILDRNDFEFTWYDVREGETFATHFENVPYLDAD
jgi:hypothetical protein